MRTYKVESLILQRRPQGEADFWLTLLTKEDGIVRVVAKGVRKIPSRRGGHVEPVSKVLALVSGRPEHYYLSAIEPLDTYAALHADPTMQRQAYLLAQVVSALLPEEEPQETLFTGLEGAWRLFPTVTLAQRLTLEVAFLLYLLRVVGVQPTLDQCYRCGINRPTDAIIFNPQAGGWHCLSCQATLVGAEQSVASELLKVLRFLEQKPEAALRVRLSPEQAIQLANAIREYVSYVIERPLPRLMLNSTLSYAR
jgi:DNA repair protein RecO (recombination protein O)